MNLHSFISLVFVLWLKLRAISFATCNDYFELTNQPYFVDKSELLTQLFDQTFKIPKPGTRMNFSSLNYFFITRPRGFGKTTNLKMIQSFAQYELGPGNATKPYNETKAYEIFGKLKVSKNEDIIRENLAQYSVLYLDLTFLPEDLIDDATATIAFAKKLANLYKPYEWFTKHITQEGAHSFLVKLLEGNVETKWIHRAAFYVSKTLSRIGGKGTIFLVDNFDSAARLAVLKLGLKGVKFLYTLIHKTLCEFAHFVKSENSGHRRTMSLITGVSEMRFRADEFETGRIYRRSVFLKHDVLSPHFGFLQREINLLMDKFNCSKQEKSNAPHYYKGYKTYPNKLYLYNPVSITGYFKSRLSNGSGELKPYWARNESLDFVAEFAKTPWFGKMLTELVAKNEIRITSRIHEQDSTFLLNFFDWSQRHFENISDDDGPLLLYYFYEHGFLKHKNENPWYAFEFANQEVRSEIGRRLKEMKLVV